LPEVRVVGLFELVFDDDLVIPAGAQDVELELAHPMLGGHQLQVGQAQRIGQRVEVDLFGEPRREVVGFMLPGFAQGYAFEFAERFFHSVKPITIFSAEAWAAVPVLADWDED